jgi:hypothetical protein
MQYPAPDAVQQSLKRFAEDVGDTTETPAGRLLYGTRFGTVGAELERAA